MSFLKALNNHKLRNHHGIHGIHHSIRKMNEGITLKNFL